MPRIIIGNPTYHNGPGFLRGVFAAFGLTVLFFSSAISFYNHFTSSTKVTPNHYALRTEEVTRLVSSWREIT
jgi:hypothetical protein